MEGADAALKKLACCECQQKIGSLDDLEAHLTLVHLEWLPYECAMCGALEATETTLRRHLNLTHPSSAASARVLYQPDKPLKRRLKQLRQRCIDQAKENLSDERGKLAELDGPESPNVLTDSIQLVLPKFEGVACSTPKPRDEPVVTVGSGLLQQSDLPMAAWEQRLLDCTFCVVCQKAFNGRGTRAIEHIYKEHMKKKPYRCSVCNFSTLRVATVRTHIARQHADEGEASELLDDRREELSAESNGWMRRCFAVRAECVAQSSAKAPPRLNEADNKPSESPETPQSKSESEHPTPDEQLTAATDSPNRLTEWQKRLRDTSFCVLCKTPAGTHPSAHIYRIHMKHNLPYGCNICNYKSVQPSIVVKHSGVHRNDPEVFAMVDRREATAAEYDGWFARCFAVREGQLQPTMTKDPPGNRSSLNISYNSAGDRSASQSDDANLSLSSSRYNSPSWQMRQRDIHYCVLCQTRINKNSIQHIFEKHMHKFPFRCSVCNRGGYLAGSIGSHIKNVHKNENASCADLREGLDSEYESWHSRCYALKDEFKKNGSATNKRPSTGNLDCDMFVKRERV